VLVLVSGDLLNYQRLFPLVATSAFPADVDRSEDRADRKPHHQKPRGLRSARSSLLSPREARRSQRSESVEQTHEIFFVSLVFFVFFVKASRQASFVKTSCRRVVAPS
jgi:hypothetical protein